MTVADIGAGDGSLAIAVVQRLGSEGRSLATELSEAQRAIITARVRRANLRQVTVVSATADHTGLTLGCCDAAYARAVVHHIGELEAFACRVADALKPGARLVIIDFPPGGLPFHGSDHGIAPTEVEAACSRAGLQLVTRVDDWGGGMYALVFERPLAAAR